MKSLRLFILFNFLAMNARADFDDLGMNARSIAMGGALTALADDAQSVPLNPAGLGYLKRAELGSDYGRLFVGLEDNSDLSLSHMALGFPIVKQRKEKPSKGTKPPAAPASFFSTSESSSSPSVPISSDTVTSEKLDLLEGRDEIPALSRKGAVALFYRKFSLSSHYEETTLGAGWGRMFGRRWAAGFNVKQLSEKYTLDDYTQVDPVLGTGGKNSISAMSVDVGALYNVIPRVFIGFGLLDVNQPNIGLKETVALPRTQKLGLGYRWNGLSSGFDWTQRDGLSTYGTGVEKLVKQNRISLRTGFQFGDAGLSTLTGGAGIKIGLARLDYAIQFPLSGVQGTVGSHRFSLVFKFGQPLPQEAEPGSLEQAYLLTQEKLMAVEAKLKETEENRNSLEKVLVEESTLRIQERIDSARALARSQVKAKPDAPRERDIRETPKVRVKTHRVEKGDTLQSLAETYYGNPAKWRIIYEENKDTVGRGGTLINGQLLIIPPLEVDDIMKSISDGAKKSKFSSNEPSSELPKTDSRSKWSRPGESSPLPISPAVTKTHVVKKGDTLQSIAQEYYGSPANWQKIYLANKEKITRGIPNTGAELVIPQ